MKKQLLFLLFGMIVFSDYSQKVVWEQTIGSEHSEYLFDMVAAVDYGFLHYGFAQQTRRIFGEIKAKDGRLKHFSLVSNQVVLQTHLNFYFHSSFWDTV